MTLQTYELHSPVNRRSPWPALQDPEGDMLKLLVEVRSVPGVHTGIASPKNRNEGEVVEKTYEQGVAKLLVPATHEHHEGYFILPTAISILRSPKSIPDGVKFSEFPASDHSCFIEGGTCSAMAFSFMARYAVRQVKSIITTPFELLKRVAKHFQTSNTTMRNLQAAMNQIEVDPILEEDVCQERKIQALAALVNMKAKAVMEFRTWERGADFSFVDALPQGMYLVRILELDPSSPKRERKGHSCVFIKTGASSFYFDCNKGLMEQVGGVASLMVRALIYDTQCRYGLDGYRFYEIKMDPEDVLKYMSLKPGSTSNRILTLPVINETSEEDERIFTSEAVTLRPAPLSAAYFEDDFASEGALCTVLSPVSTRLDMTASRSPTHCVGAWSREAYMTLLMRSSIMAARFLTLDSKRLTFDRRVVGIWQEVEESVYKEEPSRDCLRPKALVLTPLAHGGTRRPRVEVDAFRVMSVLGVLGDKMRVVNAFVEGYGFVQSGGYEVL